MLIQLFFTFLKIGAFSFGGGYAMIPLLQKEVIFSHPWLKLPEFLEVIAIAEMTPGPVAINSATYVGYRVAGFWGSVIATIGVVLPSFFIILLMAHLVERFNPTSLIRGIRPSVVGLVFAALFILGEATLVEPKAVIIGVVTFGLLVTMKKLHPVLLIGLAGLLGVVLY